jgi:hypothetical protein
MPYVTGPSKLVTASTDVRRNDIRPSTLATPSWHRAGQREALTRGPHLGRRDRAEPLARSGRRAVLGRYVRCDG